jgi:hypothetical protein
LGRVGEGLDLVEQGHGLREDEQQQRAAEHPRDGLYAAVVAPERAVGVGGEVLLVLHLVAELLEPADDFDLLLGADLDHLGRGLVGAEGAALVQPRDLLGQVVLDGRGGLGFAEFQLVLEGGHGGGDAVGISESGHNNNSVV